jgi:hypothetical protein
MTDLSHKNFLCIDCKKDTWNEYYMLYSRVWKRANPSAKGMLCIRCVEKRLKRKLTPKDFTKFPINTLETKRTAILRNRLGL